MALFVRIHWYFDLTPLSMPVTSIISVAVGYNLGGHSFLELAVVCVRADVCVWGVFVCRNAWFLTKGFDLRTFSVKHLTSGSRRARAAGSEGGVFRSTWDSVNLSSYINEQRQ